LAPAQIPSLSVSSSPSSGHGSLVLQTLSPSESAHVCVPSHDPVALLQVWPAGHALVPWHVPLLHTSFDVHAMPSLHASVFGVLTHVPDVHVSVVQTSASSHWAELVHNAVL